MEEIKVIASDELLMEQLSNRDWDEFWLRLMGRCVWVLRKRYDVKWPNDELKAFCRDAISEVVNQIFIKRSRKWNTGRYQDFEDFIVGAIDSHINNTLNKSKKEISADKESLFVDENIEFDHSIEQVIIGNELKSLLYTLLEQSDATDEELLIFECLCDGIIKPEDIRSTIGLSEDEFHNAWRRFKRKRNAIKQKLVTNGY
ncbi:hypothetical protein CMT75_17490 [Elizabethkingia anophelis]|nr:hypothetical protein [Elizabethkingia anophelis]